MALRTAALFNISVYQFDIQFNDEYLFYFICTMVIYFLSCTHVHYPRIEVLKIHGLPIFKAIFCG